MSSEVSPVQLDSNLKQPKKKRVKRDDEGQGTLQEPEKKNKACHACRRVKVSG